MSPRKLSDLRDLSKLTPAALKEREPALFADVQARVVTRTRAFLRHNFPRLTANLREKLATLDLAIGDLQGRAPKNLLLERLDAQEVSPEERAQAVRILAILERSGMLPSAIDLDRPIDQLPLFDQEVRRATVARLAEVAGIADQKVERLADRAGSVGTLTDDALDALVADDLLSRDEGARLGVAASVFNLSGGNIALATVLAAEEFASLGGRRVATLRDLAALSADDWLLVVDRAAVEPPAGLDRGAVARSFERKIASVFPTGAVLARVMPRSTKTLAPALKRLAPVFERNARVFGRRFNTLELTDLSADEIRRAREAHAELQGLANSHPGLRLTDLLDGKLTPAQKVQAISRRLGLVSQIIGQNPDTEFLTLDYRPGSQDRQGLDLEGLSSDEQHMVMENFKGFQRVFGVTDDALDTVRLLAAGYSSSKSVAAAPFEMFLEVTGLDPQTARNYYGEAASILADSALILFGINDLVRGGFNWIEGAGNVEPATLEYLRSLQGFEDLFGSQDFCQCEHCQSILGPAAYFVDLMCFTEEHALGVFAGARASHALNLKRRRPDLWTLELTCRNTNEQVPTLDLINEILENAIATAGGVDISDRAAVERAVYQDAFGSTVDSFRQPFVLPLEKLATYLSHFDRSRADVARLLTMPAETLAAAVLNLSRREYELVTQADPSLAFLRGVYGIQFVVGGDGIVTPIDVQEMLRFTGLSRPDFGSLVLTRYVTANGDDAIEIRAEKRTPDSLQNDVERIHNLTAPALDRLHRLTRLWRKIGWTIGELDLVMGHLVDRGLAQDISAAAAEHLSTIVTWCGRWGLPVEQAVALFSTIPNAAIIESRKSLLDRLFNVPPFVTTEGALPQPLVSFVHPSLRQAGTAFPANNTVNRLLAGLQLTEDQFGQLMAKLSGALGADVGAANENDRGFALSLANLSLLYRHARMAQLLDLSVADLFQLIGLSGIAGGCINGLADLVQLLEFHDWWQSSRFTLDDLSIITQAPVQHSNLYPNPETLAADIIAAVGSAHLLQFADTVFAFLAGVTEDQSRQIVAANAGVIEGIPSGSDYRLRNTFDPAAALIIPAGVGAAEPAIRALLVNYHVSTVLPVRIASRVGMGLATALEIIGMSGVDLTAAALVDSLWGGPIAPLVTLIGRIVPLSVLFKHEAYDAASLQLVRAHPGLFDLADFDAVRMSSVRRLSRYVDWSDPAKIPSDAPPGTVPDPGAVRDVLIAFDPVARFANTDTTVLGRALRVDPVLLSTLLPNLTLPVNAPDALDLVGRAAMLATTLGVGGEALGLVVSDGYGDLARAGDAVLSALRATYPDEKDFADRIEPLVDRLRSRRRDALTDYLIRSATPQFDSPNELFAYYLMDVQLEGCARTSRVLAAISSVQLYVHRSILNLEQDDLPPDDPNHVRVELSADAIAEWAWRKNSRVWEANRKVFLYPENYLEPELRDDKTPLFKTLETTLLQQRISEQNVLDAYASYMSGFEEVARLKIAGSYHDIGATSDVLHLFGVMPGDPPAYYYRTIENAYHGEIGDQRTPVYTPWRRIDVQIPVRRVAPIVYFGRLFLFWVQITTSVKNEVTANGSEFDGYDHKLIVRYTTLRLDGTWTPPQSLVPERAGVFRNGEGVVQDRLTNSVPDYDDEPHEEPIDGYTLEGFQWDRVYPGVLDSSLRLTLRNFVARAPVDFYRKLLAPVQVAVAEHQPADMQVLCSRTAAGARRLYYGVQPQFKLDDYAHCSAVADQRRLDALSGTEAGVLVACLSEGLYQGEIARINPDDEIDIVNGSVSDAILDSNGDLFLLQGSVRPGTDYLLTRLGTTLTETVVRTLFMTGVDGLLATETQLGLREAPLPITLGDGVEDASNAGGLDLTGPYGTYYQEMFFHIPFLIANHLNSQQRFASAQRWYHYIFDPTSTEVIPLPAGLDAEEREKKLRNRVWRYVKFRDLDVPKLQQILSDPIAIGVYRKDPFNPHAIARLRPTAYAKCIVMKYIDNLLDWADSLFNEFTTESLNEATLLYVMAADVLGRRPAALGECGESHVTPRTYETIAPLIKEGDGFLGEIETFTLNEHSRLWWRGGDRRDRRFVFNAADPAIDKAADTPANPDGVQIKGVTKDVTSPDGWHGTWIGSWTGVGNDWNLEIDSPLFDEASRIPGFTWNLARQFVPVFCVPPNKELLAYWDRVEDRLYKLRHCLDISGVSRKPPLFAPEIDPRLLVRARAAGLSIEDVLNATSGNLPPYRFNYLIERAKQSAATIQGVGAALMSALERKDLEELNRLHLVHQQNLLHMTSRVRDWEIAATADAIAALERQQAAAEYRKTYYAGLVDDGLIAPENVQQVARWTASTLEGGAALLRTVAGITYLIPQVGSPFSMKYGGQELGNSYNTWSMVMRDGAALAETVSALAGLESGFARREQGWQHQVDLAGHELKQIEKQIAAARLRLDIAVRSRDLHAESLNQLDELREFYGDRFSSLGLYTWLSTTLQRTYREAYNSAYAMARLAEQAYRYERGDETTGLLQSDYWEATKVGLLAGERLLVDLQNLERRFIETNYRRLEIDQAFSLTHIDPAALVTLRETGTCTFAIPELSFDLFYPGQYRRRITSVRLTVPCITGPYTNVGATLTLIGSRIRNAPVLDVAGLTEVPIRRSTSVATSTAQNDAGVFEFSFRDERYMPFEGAGAISNWRLSLPRSFRQFDYQTITDVMLHVSYTAEHDALFRDQVENLNAAIEGSLLHTLSTVSLARSFSFRQDFSSAFHRLLHGPLNTLVNVELSDRYLPVFLRGRDIEVSRATLALKPVARQGVNGFQLAIDGAAQAGFVAEAALGNLPSTDVTALFAGGLIGTRAFAVTGAGDLAASAPAPGDVSAVDADKLLDLLLHVEVRLR